MLVTPDPAAAVTLLGGRVEHRDGQRLVVHGGDPALINAELVHGGVAVRELGAQRQTLEEIILERTSAGSDRVDAALESARA